MMDLSCTELMGCMRVGSIFFVTPYVYSRRSYISYDQVTCFDLGAESDFLNFILRPDEIDFLLHPQFHFTSDFLKSSFIKDKDYFSLVLFPRADKKF
ncbi:hypothetical protein NPIL_193561 [Nephila pilipes]|uniref:Uncharacterized protein n=1 Tax=Nephila pilipes TaxID=299642 RepID=A0A8X6MML9_NEPPI|nr:hypothetical protein NPIL_193561 [Nephila pilipes]